MFFDFLGAMDEYRDHMVTRMNLRHRFLIEPFEEELKDARVFDVAAHDGRWSYALAAAGAREVVGVEARAELIELYKNYPDAPFKDRVALRHNDLFRELDTLVAAQEVFDVVALYGILYHVTDHLGLLAKAAMLKPKIIIVDSEFITAHVAKIHLIKERTEGELNATALVPEQEVTLVGIPSTGAMERMAEVLGYHCEWLNWHWLPEEERVGVKDYYRDKPKRRRTCVLRPMDSA